MPHVIKEQPKTLEPAIKCEVITEHSNRDEERWLVLVMPNGQVVQLLIPHCEQGRLEVKTKGN